MPNTTPNGDATDERGEEGYEAQTVFDATLGTFRWVDLDRTDTPDVPSVVADAIRKHGLSAVANAIPGVGRHALLTVAARVCSHPLILFSVQQGVRGLRRLDHIAKLREELAKEKEAQKDAARHARADRR